ncbi:Cmx/CmrA family chloramphenicol efflux MFS transporter [Streptomyces cavernicola]|uniref:MFS transporter n=1 Tax=Streptomyces cavernicola TaxID=3043613 RepID=A0ABT6S5Q2_9ACTN|nr:Cmx/CmrA family chloramphenicol efflux MFS transporter [Streptomyces sp. B-S-A6]MDI3403424.1 MFS transporter [Streptomyces sp. B-S-A6]
MPLTVHLLGLAVFAMGTSEFMLSGLGPDIAAELHVSLPTVATLTSVFAVGMIVGAPAAALLSLRLPRRTALLGFLGAFLLTHVAGALTSSFAALLVLRFVGALANAGFLAVALATAVSLVAPDAKGRATSALLGGVTVSCVAGVPGGALLTQLWGWRAAFWAVALLSLPALLALVRSVPAGHVEGAPRPDARRELAALRRPRLQLALLLGALVNGATFCAFTYLAPLLTDVTGLAASWVPVLLALFGVGSFAGVTLGGRYADTHAARLLAFGTPALCLAWPLLALAAGSAPAVLTLTFVQGALSFAVGSTLISRALYAAPDAPTLGGAYATAAFNVGAALGPWLGGLPVAAGSGFRAPLWVSAGLVGLAGAVGGAVLLVRKAAVTRDAPDREVRSGASVQ